MATTAATLYLLLIGATKLFLAPPGEPMADLAYLMRAWVGPDEPAGPHLEPPTRAGGCVMFCAFCSRPARNPRSLSRTAKETPDDLVYRLGFELLHRRLRRVDTAHADDRHAHFSEHFLRGDVALGRQAGVEADDIARAREAGLLAASPEEAWGNAAIPGFGIGQPTGLAFL